ncbi:MAG: tRNA pseudouridine(38-40) synthase TruA [Propionibacteriaceae bacterium]|jgi:tRNA pseudouridine38-40 synthase|nr:tRNA pseudouridine(38-40) synthase TruA [Propionibacteriaceae bacterium]
MTRLRLDIGYDGTDFHGWAAQVGAAGELRTVQGELQLWISRILRAADLPPLVVAGRTDAGVHARGQVAHLDIPDSWDAEERASHLAYRLRAALPDDISVKRVTIAPAGFDARFAAIWRRYVYRITDKAADPLTRNHVVAWPHAIDLDVLNAAGATLLGLRDFAAFCKFKEGGTSIRKLLDVAAERVCGQNGCEFIELTFRADAFCHSMVRSLTGGLIDVATGKREVDWLTRLLQTGKRCSDVRVMPACGLTLEEVGYPAAGELAARAIEARARRKLCRGDEE